jgi:DNA-binding MarR family transcriptional regulator
MAKRAGISAEYVDDGIRELWANHLVWMDLLPNGNAAIIKLLPLEDRYPPEKVLTKQPRTYAESIKLRKCFVRLSNAVLRDHELSRSAKLVFMQLVRHSNGHKLHYSNGDPAFGTWAGESTIADDLGVSVNTVKRGMASLCARGIILRQDRGNDATSITLIPDLQKVYADRPIFEPSPSDI